MTRYALWIAALALFSATGLADVIEVPADYPTIQQAIDASKTGVESLATSSGRAVTIESRDADALIRGVDSTILAERTRSAENSTPQRSEHQCSSR